MFVAVEPSPVLISPENITFIKIPSTRQKHYMNQFVYSNVVNQTMVLIAFFKTNVLLCSI